MMDSKRSKAGRERTKTTATRMKMKTTEPEVDHDYGNDGIKAGAGKVSETTRCQKQSTHGIRMVEFFSGIGGFRLGVERAIRVLRQLQENGNGSDGNKRSETGTETSSCNYRLDACHAYEISLNANDTYRHNFHQCRQGESGSQSNNNTNNSQNNFTVKTKLIEQLSTSTIASHDANLWTMSPPCQPFTSTTNAKRLDARDPRTAGFRSIMMLLDDISTHQQPQWIVLENVKGFVGSDMLTEFYDCLERNGYGWREYLLSPMQIGIPNHRRRYYLVAEKDSARFGRERGGDSIRETLPCMEDCEEIRRQPLLEYIDQSLTDEEMSKFMVSDEILAKPWAKSLPIVSANDTMSHCFTAAYGRVVHRATGALLLTDTNHPSVEQHPELIDRSDMTKLSGKLRKFTPKELLQIFGYGDGFDFPENVSLEHQYKLIGNSVNVNMIAKVLEVLLSP